MNFLYIIEMDSNTKTSQRDDFEDLSVDLSQKKQLSKYNSYSYGAPPKVEIQMRRELKYMFMNSYEKYKTHGRKPWNLGVQILKIVLFTSQVSETISTIAYNVSHIQNIYEILMRFDTE